ncbi:MAG TPA: T9SS type A sorting domain-containing protein, partial [Ignavibacteria bacterium]
MKNETVKITVFDILGRRIETLVNQIQSPGIYEINFNGSNYSGGVYFYKLEAGDYSTVKKMLLVK